MKLPGVPGEAGAVSAMQSVADVTELDGISRAGGLTICLNAAGSPPARCRPRRAGCTETCLSGSTEAHRRNPGLGGQPLAIRQKPSPAQSNPDVLSDAFRPVGQGGDKEQPRYGEAAMVQEGESPSQGVRAKAALSGKIG